MTPHRISLAVVFMVITGSLSAQVSPEAAALLKHREHLQDLLRGSDGLHKAALEEGGHFTLDGPTLPRNRANSIEQLVSRSSVIVTGTVIGESTAL